MLGSDEDGRGRRGETQIKRNKIERRIGIGMIDDRRK